MIPPAIAGVFEVQDPIAAAAKPTNPSPPAISFHLSNGMSVPNLAAVCKTC
jgi:hypothetical protein